METAVVIVIGGLMVQAFVTGAAMIKNARVRNIISQQMDLQIAFAAFADRYHALPGDYAAASTNIDCGSLKCLDGDGSGRIDGGGGGGLREDILAWHHLSASGFITGRFQYFDASVNAPDDRNSPTNVFGGYLQIVSDGNYGFGSIATTRNNIKTGDRVPSDVLAEADRKIDDGFPASGRFQFSSYDGTGERRVSADACTSVSDAVRSWNRTSGTDECGAASIID
jgi:hypothetical protein